MPAESPGADAKGLDLKIAFRYDVTDAVAFNGHVQKSNSLSHLAIATFISAIVYFVTFRAEIYVLLAMRYCSYLSLSVIT